MVSKPEVLHPYQAVAPPHTSDGSLQRLLARGVSSVGVAASFERGLGFLANVMAARVAGPHSFGTYSIVLATAGTIANYAGLGVGSTSNRFSGQYPIGSAGYRQFLRAIVLVALLSALVASVLLLVLAEPVAQRLLHNPELTGVLRFAALSGGALILLECARGLFIGQQKFVALLLLSTCFAGSLFFILPNAARISPRAMIAGHGVSAVLAVGVCVLFSRSLGIISTRIQSSQHEGPTLRAIFEFGLVQLSAVIALNVAVWWMASLVTRSDSSMLQMGLYAVANQFRGLVSIMPGLFAQVSYPLLTAESGSKVGGPNHVLLTSTFLGALITLTLASAGVITLPWILPTLYGSSFAAAELPCVLLLATAVVHMTNAPAANRLTIVNIRMTGVINTMWAIALVGVGVWLVPRFGARGAATAFFIAHLFSHVAVLVVLKQQNALPPRLWQLSMMTIGGALFLNLISYLRIDGTLQVSIATAILLAALAALTTALFIMGKRQRWIVMRASSDR